jgi:hypothetical protein
MHPVSSVVTALILSASGGLVIACAAGTGVSADPGTTSGETGPAVPSGAPTWSGGNPVLIDAAGPDEAAPHDAGMRANMIDAGTGTTDAGETTDAKGATDSARVTDSSTTSSDGASGCQYATVFEQMGTVLEVGSDQSQVYYWMNNPLPDGGGFYCMKVEFDMQTEDTLVGVGSPDSGCPIYTLISGIRGMGPAGTLPSHATLMAGAQFKFLDLNCDPGTHRIELDTAWDSVTTAGPWNLGGLYHFAIEVKPFTSTVTVSQGGVVVGSAVTASITGASVPDTVNPRVDLGDPTPGKGSNWPNYGSSYSNVVISADVAP